MKKKPIKLIALIAAVLAIYAIFSVLTSAQREQEAQNVPTVQVVVAAIDVASGTTLTADMLTVRDVSQTELLSGALTDQTAAVGQVVNQAIYQGEQIVAGKLGGTWLSYKVEEGMRAVSLSVEIESGVAGLIRPNDAVDILYTEPSGQVDRGGLDFTTTTTTSLMQEIKVLAIDQVYNEDLALLRAADAVYASVTLEVTPEQATQLAQTTAQRDLNSGRITLALHPRDRVQQAAD